MSKPRGYAAGPQVMARAQTWYLVQVTCESVGFDKLYMVQQRSSGLTFHEEKRTQHEVEQAMPADDGWEARYINSFFGISTTCVDNLRRIGLGIVQRDFDVRRHEVDVEPKALFVRYVKKS